MKNDDVKKSVTELHIGRLSLNARHHGSAAQLKADVERELSRLLSDPGSAPVDAIPFVNQLRGTAPAPSRTASAADVAGTVHRIVTGTQT